ncbi:Sec-independent protein translocase subunit TatA [Nonomuraea sp. NPDC050556]|uniref:Sec-independent protein translocase subunit TatA n=1 Tax=Nonomuraea sp. NPDC050556 TaxID=3364369 RepID=UPI00378C95C6
MPNLGTGEIILIIVALVLLFGAKKLPDAARGIGRSLRIFKAEATKLRDDDDDPSTVTATTATAQPAPAPPAAQLPATPAPTAEEQAALLEAQAARLRAESANKNNA